MTPAGGLAEQLADDLAAYGLIARGGFSLRAGEAYITTGEGGRFRSVLLIGHAGSSLWESFSRWRAAQPETIADPLDSWSKAVLAPIAARHGGQAVFPSERPYHPFQQWAKRAEGLSPSPLGMLIHPDYGLWHGYRGAILFADDGLFFDETKQAAFPCESCAEKPCLAACPVGAFSVERYDVAGCRSYLATEAGRAGCMTGGCLARDACPVGREYRYCDEQIRFHMAAFASA